MIIHKTKYTNRAELIVKKNSGVLVKKPFYLCNQAVNAKKEKCRLQWKYVTCKNCLKQKGEQ